MKKIAILLTSALALIGLLATSTAAAPGDGGTKDLTITEIVAASGDGSFDDNHGDFDILLNAVLTAGLEGALADEAAMLTVFAPNDAAFVRTATDLGFTGETEEEAWAFLVEALTGLGEGDPIPVLTNILLYHVAPGKIGISKLLFDTDSVDTLLEGASFGSTRLKLNDADPDIKDPKIKLRRSNITAKNGKIHVINRVLIPLDL